MVEIGAREAEGTLIPRERDPCTRSEVRTAFGSRLASRLVMKTKISLSSFIVKPLVFSPCFAGDRNKERRKEMRHALYLEKSGFRGDRDMKNVLVPVADGGGRLETVAIIDVLRRAGANVVIATVNGPVVTGSKGVKLVADRLLSDCAHEPFDVIALPGGMPGAERLRDSAVLIALLKRQADEGRLYATLCASPAVALYPYGLLRGKRFTCHPYFSQGIGDGLSTEPVVVDGNLVTGRGAGTAVDFALTLAELLYGREKAKEVRQGMAM